MPATTQKPRKKSVARIQDILHAATRIFLEKGYKGTSLQDIAQSAGITKAGIYHHFKTKEEILYSILATHDEANIETFKPIRLEIENTDINPVEAVKKIIRAYAKLTATEQNISLLGMRERDQLTGINRERYRRINQRILTDVKADIAGVGVTKPSLDLNTIVFMVFAMSSWFGYWVKDGGELTLEEAIEQSIEIICNGVLKK